MNHGKSNLAMKVSSHAPDVFTCKNEPMFSWILSDTTTFQAAITTKCITCPIIILLNVLVIVAVAKRRQSQKNSNILLASLAVADFLVGAISMPLSISLDALLLDKNTTVDESFCRLAFANQLVLYAAVCSSLYHMTLIAWERYVAIRNWMYYKAIVTRRRVKTCTAIAWLLAVLTTTPVRILTALGLDYKYTKILDKIFFLPALVCLVLIGHFYLMVNLSVRSKQKINGVSASSAPARAKMVKGIANTTAILALALLISYVPSIAIRFLGEIVPILRTSSFFCWSEVLSQLNSLVNPLLYCFVLNGNFRREAVKMLKMRGCDEIQSLTRVQRRRTRRVSTITRQGEHDAQGFAERELEDCFEMPGSRDGSDGADYCKSRRAVVEESSSYLAVVNRVIRVNVHQPKTIKCKPSIKASGSVMNTEGQAHGTSGQCRCFLHHHRNQSCDQNDVIDKTQKPDTLVPSPNSNQPKSIRFQQELEVASSVTDKRDQADGTSGQTQCSLYRVHQENGNKNAVVEQNKTNQKTETLAPSPNSKQPKSVGVHQELEVTSSVSNRSDQADGTIGQTQCSLHRVHQENGNKNAVVELASGQNKTTQGPKKTASSQGSYAAPEETGVILSFPEQQQRCKYRPTREKQL